MVTTALNVPWMFLAPTDPHRSHNRASGSPLRTIAAQTIGARREADHLTVGPRIQTEVTSNSCAGEISLALGIGLSDRANDNSFQVILHY